jgi:dephospho-CoA kinase
MGRDAVIVITGPIGSGKSYVTDLFSQRSWQVIDADLVGHEVLRDAEVINLIAERWPQVVRGEVVNRKLLADVVFGNRENLEVLEQITHPLIQVQIDDWLATSSGRRAIEVSVLKAIRPAWGEVVVIDAPLEIRKQRLQERGLDRAAAQLRLDVQPPRRAWLEAANIVLENRAPGRTLSLRLIDFLDRRV